jgi:hypothetical protein
MTGHLGKSSLIFVIQQFSFRQFSKREPGREPGIFSTDISGTFLAQRFPRFTKNTSQEGNNFR